MSVVTTEPEAADAVALPEAPVRVPLAVLAARSHERVRHVLSCGVEGRGVPVAAFDSCVV